MRHVLLLGAGKSATTLIRYLIDHAETANWTLTVADADPGLASRKTGNAPRTQVAELDITDNGAREKLIGPADIVISLLPPSLHLLAAQTCLELGKNLLTASYIDPETENMRKAVADKGLLFLYEMGLDPGIDHMSAMQLVNRIRREGGNIFRFLSHCGGLVAPESDDNPWHYKISWNPRNILRAGSAGAVYKENGKPVRKTYAEVFKDCRKIKVDSLPDLAWYPNRDSLSYMQLYGLEDCETFIRTTLRYPSFCENWQSIVAAGLTDDQQPVDTRQSYRQWASALGPYTGEKNREAFRFLGLEDDHPIPPTANTNADVLQTLLENKLKLGATDKDMIVMVHEFSYRVGHKEIQLRSSLVVKGEDPLNTAMSKTVGLPLGIAARLILDKKIELQGLHIPVSPRVYEPVLEELSAYGIAFREEQRPQ